MSRAEALTALEQQAGELSCLVHMASDLAIQADDTGDVGALWRLRALLGAVQLKTHDLHDCAAECVATAQGCAA